MRLADNGPIHCLLYNTKDLIGTYPHMLINEKRFVTSGNCFNQKKGACKVTRLQELILQEVLQSVLHRLHRLDSLNWLIEQREHQSDLLPLLPGYHQD